MTAYRNSEVPQTFSPPTLPMTLDERVSLTLRQFLQLDSPVQWMRFCYVCNGDHVFVADRVCNSGLVGTCSNCGDERIAPFTRVNSEVA